MKLLLPFLFLLLGLSIQAQDIRFAYYYTFIPDSTNRAEVKSELMNLDVSKSGSRFYSYTKYRSDSVTRVNLEKQLMNTGNIMVKSTQERGAVKYSVTKKYPEYTTYLHSAILGEKYKIPEERTMVWKITSEKKKIGDWTTQRAETYFAGRLWFAWFTTDIPVQDGPYKFKGLPGLIVRMEDSTQSHVFTLQSVKNISSIESAFFDANELIVSAKRYSQLLKDYENDPAGGIKKLMAGGMTMIRKDGPNSSVKDQEKRMKERFRKDNNRIELNAF